MTHRGANPFRFCDEGLIAGALEADQDRAQLTCQPLVARWFAPAILVAGECMPDVPRFPIGRGNVLLQLHRVTTSRRVADAQPESAHERFPLPFTRRGSPDKERGRLVYRRRFQR